MFFVGQTRVKLVLSNKALFYQEKQDGCTDFYGHVISYRRELCTVNLHSVTTISNVGHAAVVTSMHINH